MEILSFDRIYLPGAKAVLQEAFQRPDSDPLYNEWEFARRLLEDPAYRPELCLAAVQSGAVAGYSALTPARAGGETGLALGPLAVAEACRGKGIGSALVREGLRRAKAGGWPWVTVLGGAYYARFGFEPAGPYGLTVSEDAFENEHLQVLVLGEGGAAPTGRLAYCGAFYDEKGRLL